MTVYLVRQGNTIHGVWLDHAQAMKQAQSINSDRRPLPAFGGGRQIMPYARVEPHTVKDGE